MRISATRPSAILKLVLIWFLHPIKLLDSSALLKLHDARTNVLESFTPYQWYTSVRTVMCTLALMYIGTPSQLLECINVHGCVSYKH
jgi:hypothetical protein